MRILVLTKYGRMGASSRMRLWQYLPWLQDAGINVVVQPLLSDELLQARYQRGSYGLSQLLAAYVRRCQVLMQRHHFDLVWIDKEALPWWPLWIELALLRGIPYVLDYDDAIFHNYDQHPSMLVRLLYGRRIDNLMRGARLVVAGNEYLAQRARDAGSKHVEIIPTVIDLERYTLTTDPVASQLVPRIVWIGSPTTTRYLSVLHDSLASLARSFAFKLRIVGGTTIDLPGVDVERFEWTEASEVPLIQECDIGIMPLIDSPWERGKCGYKLIQYMACAKPVVASPVGVNQRIVEHGVNGWLARSTQDWTQAFTTLLSDPDLRMRMGKAGRDKVERDYTLQANAPRLEKLLSDAAGEV